MEKATVLDYRKVFQDSPHGKAILEDMKKAHHFYSSTAPVPFDPYMMAICEGERNVILRILTILESKE